LAVCVGIVDVQIHQHVQRNIIHDFSPLHTGLCKGASDQTKGGINGLQVLRISQTTAAGHALTSLNSINREPVLAAYAKEIAADAIYARIYAIK
jgi:hypothetical protein